ncbi:MAG TPA: response regulator transcription factor [Burkholderiaceae bacterium]|nr:response regulator transcription factor [Burkholderiaceae bacterium]
MQRLLMIDDDARLAAMVRDYLAASGYGVDVAGDVASGIAALRARPADLLILDLMLPDGDGLDVCRRLRAEGVGIPVLMLTAKGDPIDRVIGLEIGADDYLPKPFEPRELLARVKALLRRASGAPAADSLRFGRLEVDRAARAVRVDGQARPLTSHQFDLLVALAERAGRVLSREQLMDLVRGEALETFDRSIDVHIARIRAAVEDDPRHPKRIITVRGAGYVFARSQDAS